MPPHPTLPHKGEGTSRDFPASIRPQARRLRDWIWCAPAPGWHATEEHAWTLRACFVLLWLVLAARLGEAILPAWDDLTHAAIGRAILQTGDWFTMHDNGAPTWIKPPLYFWLEALLFKLTGPIEWSARFPAALAGFGCFALLYSVARRLHGAKTAFLSLFVLGTSFLFLKYARRAMLDVPIAFATLGAVWALVRGEEDRRFDFWIGPAVALGYYFKAVQGMYAAPIAVVYLLATGQARRLFGGPMLAGAAAGLGLMAAWIAPQLRTWGETFLQSQCGLLPILHRGVHDKPLPFYLPLQRLLQEDWPWIPVSVAGLYFTVRRPGWFRDRASVLLLVWTCVILGELMAVNTFYARYLVPVLPPLALAAGLALDRWVPDDLLRRFSRCALGLTAVSLLAIFTLPIPLEKPRGTSHFLFLKTVNSMIPKDAPLALYKANPWSMGQGLGFYADRLLNGHAASTSELVERRKTAPGPLFVVSQEKDFPELSSALPARVLARPDGWVLAELPTETP